MEKFEDYDLQEYKVVSIRNNYTSLWIKLHKINKKIKLRNFIKHPFLKLINKYDR